MKNFLYLLVCIALQACILDNGEKPEIKNNGVTIAYERSGSGDTALVFVHGWCISKEYWRSQQDYFSKRFTTVAIDLGGHGQSGTNRNSWTQYDFAEDVIAVINGLALKKVILVGHSMSGDVNLIVANRIPATIAGFVGVDNLKGVITSFSPEEQKGIGEFLTAIKNNFDTVATAYCYSSLFPPNYADSVSMKRVVTDVQQIDSTIAIKTLEGLIPATLEEDKLLSGLRVPLFLIVSDFGPVNDVSVRKYCKAGLYVKTINGVGHYPMIEQPDEFNHLLEESVNEMGSAGR